MMRKLLSLLLAFLLCFGSSASALEWTEAEVETWFDDMVYMVEEIGLRKVGRPGEKIACDYLRQRFLDMGFSYEDGTLQDSLCRAAQKYDESTSLVAIKRAKNENPQIVTICAHYDSNSEGARDNASGVSAMLLLAEKYAGMEPFDNTELRFIAFAAEELGMHGSAAYCAQLTPDEAARCLAVFNIDIITVDVWEPLAFSIDTMGMRANGAYVSGTDEQPAYNRTALAMLQAMEEMGTYPIEDEDFTWCLPRHWGQSDHEPFHNAGIDAANICFHGTRADGGKWPEFMHTPSDIIGDFDFNRTWDALNAVYTAVDGIANDHSYGLAYTVPDLTE